ncbi:MAG: hypothetical protein ACFFAO_13090, partial [Candidatus Hermodarchaeota archaeon]
GDGPKTVYYQIRDNAGHTYSTSDTIELDTIIPYIISVSSTANNGTYKIGDTIMITVIFSEIIHISGTGTIQICLETGDIDAIVDYTSGSDTNILMFSYTVKFKHNSTDLDYNSTDALLLNGASIRDLAGNEADPILPAPGTPNSLSANKDIIIYGFPDETPPSDGGGGGGGGGGGVKDDVSELSFIIIATIISTSAIGSVIAVILIRKHKR